MSSEAGQARQASPAWPVMGLAETIHGAAPRRSQGTPALLRVPCCAPEGEGSPPTSSAERFLLFVAQVPLGTERTNSG